MDLKNSLGGPSGKLHPDIDFHSLENMIHTKIAPIRTIRNF